MPDLAMVQTALLSLPTLASVTRGHPPRDAALPCAAYALTEDRPVARYDDADYLRQTELTLRLYAATPAALDAPAAEIDAALAALGYARAAAFDATDEPIPRRTLRYTITH